MGLYGQALISVCKKTTNSQVFDKYKAFFPE
jgi:hypothetical protein